MDGCPALVSIFHKSTRTLQLHYYYSSLPTYLLRSTQKSTIMTEEVHTMVYTDEYRCSRSLTTFLDLHYEK